MIVPLVFALVVPSPIVNVKIAERTQGMSPCEPSIAICSTDPKKIVAGVVLDRAIFSGDGGKSWAETKLTSQYGVFGDPTIISDHKGDFYFFHLSSGKTQDSWLDRIVCQKSTDGGKTWSDGVGIGHNPPADQDKQWAVAHPSKPTIAASWTQFDIYGSKDPKSHSNIYFSISNDAGATWSDGMPISDIPGDCLDDDTTTEGAVPAITPDGKIHVVWGLNGILFYDRSADGGKTWLKNDRPIAKQYGGWNMEIPGVNRCNGMPVLIADTGSTPTKGNLYVVYADQRNGESDTDIFFLRSRDGGETWSSPIRVNKDAPGKQQFLPWMAVDASTGYIYIVYYDRRAYSDDQTDVYIACSTDAGTTFKERKISEAPFLPTKQPFFGDYNNISAVKGVIAPIWTRMDNGRTTVWTAVFKYEDLLQ